MLKDRIIDTIGSDHSPAPAGTKQLTTGDIRGAWGGIASLQLLLSALEWAEISSQWPNWIGTRFLPVTERPAKLVGLSSRKGSIACGLDADIVVFDPAAQFTVTAELLHHRHKATPYLGRTLRGVIETTYLRGRRIYDRGELLGGPDGRIVKRSAS